VSTYYVSYRGDEQFHIKIYAHISNHFEKKLGQTSNHVTNLSRV